MIELGKYIAEQRKARGLTQEQLGLLTGLGRGYIAPLETGKIVKPSADVFLRIAKALHIKPEELFAIAGYIKATKVNPKEETVSELLSQLKMNMNQLEKRLSKVLKADFTYHIYCKSA